MPEIVLKNVTKRWGKFYAVDHLNLHIDDNSFITLLGPSGCGKTTILRMIAGLETPTEGQITIGDRVVFDSAAGINVPANKRKVGFLFQNYALWPNMTVYQNIAFGLSNIKEQLPKYDFEAMKAGELKKALQSGKRICDLVEECRDKRGKLDEDKIYLKFMDSFTLSIYTAKELYGLKIHEAADPDAAASKKSEEYSKKLEEIRASYEAKGQSLSEQYAVTADGKTLMEERKLTKEEIDKAVRRVSRIVKIGMFMNRYPAELSGGQQQRVAIARTLAPEPDVLFMDEPLSNLDAKLRLEMRYELQRLHVETGSTFVYVTHDQEEAMTMSDRIAVMNAGVIEHLASPSEIYNQPKTRFVANFIGESNIFTGEVKKLEDHIAEIKVEQGDVKMELSGFEQGEQIHVCVRPEVMKYSKTPVDGFSLEGTVKNVIFVGAQYRTLVTMDNGYDVKINRVKHDNELKEGDRIYLYWDLEDATGIKAQEVEA